MKKFVSLSIAAASITMAGSAMAVTADEALGAFGITANGYVEGGYYYQDIDALGNKSFNDFQDGVNGFDIQQAGITLTKKNSNGFGGVVNVTAGNNASTIASAGTSNTDDVDITQAYLQYSKDGWTVMGGKFLTLVGSETIDPSNNSNVSRSIGFFKVAPYTHTGIRASYAFNAAVSVTAGINNGWDQQVDSNAGKTIETGITWVSSDMVTLAVIATRGEEVVDPSAVVKYSATRSVINTITTIKPTDKLKLVLDVANAKQTEATGKNTADAKFGSLAITAAYQFDPQWRIAFRGEQFTDANNYRLQFLGLPPTDALVKIKAATFTVGYAPVANFELRTELRRDSANVDSFTKDGKKTDKLNFVAVEGVYKF